MINEHVPLGFCQCGCGQKTNLARQNDKRYGHVKGQPIKYINSHNQKGKLSHRWNGGRTKKGDYWVIQSPTHKRAYRGYVYEHILVWEAFHNKSVPNGYVVHHINGIKTDNRIDNLVVLSSKHHANLIPILTKRIQELEQLLKLNAHP